MNLRAEVQAARVTEPRMAARVVLARNTLEVEPTIRIQTEVMSQEVAQPVEMRLQDLLQALQAVMPDHRVMAIPSAPMRTTPMRDEDGKTVVRPESQPPQTMDEPEVLLG